MENLCISRLMGTRISVMIYFVFSSILIIYVFCKMDELLMLNLNYQACLITLMFNIKSIHMKIFYSLKDIVHVCDKMESRTLYKCM